MAVGKISYFINASDKTTPPNNAIEPVLDQCVFDVGKTPRRDCSKNTDGLVCGCLQGCYVVRLEVRGHYEAHLPAARGETRDATRSQREAGAGEIACGPTIQDGMLKARYEEVADKIVAPGAVRKLKRKLG